MKKFVIAFVINLIFSCGGAVAQSELKPGNVYYAHFQNGIEGYVVFLDKQFLFFKKALEDTRPTDSLQTIGLVEGSWSYRDRTLQMNAEKGTFQSFSRDIVKYNATGGKNLDSIYLSFNISSTNGRNASVVIEFADLKNKPRLLTVDSDGKLAVTLGQQPPIKSITVSNMGFSPKTLSLNPTSNIHDYSINFLDTRSLLSPMTFSNMQIKEQRFDKGVHFFADRISFEELRPEDKHRFFKNTFFPIVRQSTYLSSRWMEVYSK